MAITSTDIKFLLSKSTATAGYAETSTIAQSLGKFASTTVVADGANTVFDDVTGAENAAQESEYRCVFVLNDHASLTLQNAVIFLNSQVAGGATIAIALDDLTQSPKNYAYAQAAFIANEDTTPVGVGSFSAPSSAITGLSIGNLAAGNVRAIWVKRDTHDTSALNNDGVTFEIDGDTAA